MWSRYDRRSSAHYRLCTGTYDAHRGQSTPPRRRQDAVDGRECRPSRLVRSQSADNTRRTSGAAASTRFHEAAYRRYRGLNLDEEQRPRHSISHGQRVSEGTSNSAQRRQKFRRVNCLHIAQCLLETAPCLGPS